MWASSQQQETPNSIQFPTLHPPVINNFNSLTPHPFANPPFDSIVMPDYWHQRTPRFHCPIHLRHWTKTLQFISIFEFSLLPKLTTFNPTFPYRAVSKWIYIKQKMGSLITSDPCPLSSNPLIPNSGLFGNLNTIRIKPNFETTRSNMTHSI